MWFSPHENHAREAQVLFYLVPKARSAYAADFHLGVPGGGLFREKSRVGAPRRVTVAPGDVQSRPKSPLRPQGL